MRLVELTTELRERLDELKTRRDELDRQLKLLEDKLLHCHDYIYGELFERIEFNVVVLFTVEHFG
jgi:cell division protein FtsB